MDLMGEVHHGIPPKLATDLQRKYDLVTFVETGTLVGKTAEWAASRFTNVYTMELSYNWFVIAKEKLKKYENVQLLHGRSQSILYHLAPRLKNPTLFWLDAHWSNDLGYPRIEPAVCPVLEEIEHIGKSELAHVILVDDFRLFGYERGWPTKDRVKKALEAIGKEVTFSEDVFIAVPNGKE